MNYLKLLAHTFGVVAVGVTMYLFGKWIFSFGGNPGENNAHNVSFFIHLLAFWITSLFSTIVSIGLLQILSAFIDIFKAKNIKKIIKLILLYLYIFLGIEGIITCGFLIYWFNPGFVALMKKFLLFPVEMIKAFLSNPDGSGLPSFGFSLFFALIPIFGLLLLYFLFTIIIYFVYFVIQAFSQTYKANLATFAFINIQFFKLFAYFTLFLFFTGSILTGYTLVKGMIDLAVILPTFPSSKIILLLFITLFFFYVGINMLIVASILLCLSIPFFLSIVTLPIKRSQLKSSIQQSVINFNWSYMCLIVTIFEAILPYSLLGIFKDIIHIGFIQVTISFAFKSQSIVKSNQAKQIAKDYCYKILNHRSLFIAKQKYNFVSNIATKLFRFGDLKFAEELYEELWKYVNSHRHGFFSPKYILDNCFLQLSQYYIETYQFTKLKQFLDNCKKQEQSGQLSKSVYAATGLKEIFERKQYTASVFDEYIKDGFNINNNLEAFLSSSNWAKLNIFNPKNPKELYKMVMKSIKVDELIPEHQESLIYLKEKLDTIFGLQNQLYLFFTGESSQTLENQEDLECTLPNQEDLELLLNRVFSFELFGIPIKFENLFLRENRKLIPLAYLLNKQLPSKKVFDSLKTLAKKENDRLELAFLSCWQGKLYLENNIVEDGLNYIDQGIELYEGIRHSIISDNLGVGFGSTYLEYYGWAIEGLIKQNKAKEAFEYVDRSTARALLDLVSKRTYSFDSSMSSDAISRLIKQIQEIDFNIHYLQASIYETSFLNRILPTLFKQKLENIFYKNNERRINYLVKQKNNFIKELDKLDPVSATLVSTKALSWEVRNKNKDKDNFIPFESLWNSDLLSEQEAILNFHVTYKLNFISNEKQWDKIYCFVLYLKEGKLQLDYHMVEEIKIIEILQQQSQTIATDIKPPKNSQSQTKNLAKKAKKFNQDIAGFSENLIIPLLKYLSGDFKSLTICANSELQFFPWSILYDEERNRLVERFQIRIAPNLSLLYLLKQRETYRPNLPSQFLIAGIQQYPDSKENLFWSGVEVKRLFELYYSGSTLNNSVSMLKDEDVDLYFSDKFSQAEVIHYSGHGVYKKPNSEDVTLESALERSYLKLCNKEISAADIIEKRILFNPTAKVMILSACLTGKGDLTTSGSEILGLERALFHAGLSSLLTTLWKVDEFATVLLMWKLHTVWKENNNTVSTLAASLREAQLWLKELSWKQLKQDFPEFGQDLTNWNCDCQKNNENAAEFKELFESESLEKSFQLPYYWAAFQVKGLG